MNKRADTSLILLDIRSAENVGAIFRTADAAGVSLIYLIGTTPTPVDRFGRARKDIAKSALGAEKTVPYEYKKSATMLLKKLKKEKVQLIAIEQDARAIDYKKVHPKFPAAFVLGNEVEGIPKNLLKLCNVVAEIPQRGMKESLNVSVAAGIALFRMLGV